MKAPPAMRCGAILVLAATAFAGQQVSPPPARNHVARVLAQQEYHFAPARGDGGAWSAPSRAHGFRTRVSADGVHVTPRAAATHGQGPEWTLTIATQGFGRGEHAIGLARATVCTNDERAELDHGPLVEWLVNDARGLEQGWTIARPPAGDGAVFVLLTIGGDLGARIDDARRSLTFADACGEDRLRYGGLAAFDATGRELDARFESHRDGLRLVVDDRGAAYPVTIDPVLTGPAWTAAPDQDGALFALSVAAAGDVNGDGFSDVIVGAPSFDGGELDEGRAFVFHGSASGLSTSADWTVECDQDAAQFACSVATAGDVDGDGFSDVIVGSKEFKNGNIDEGAAFVYLGSASGLNTTPAWTAESDQDGALFGSAVATAGDVDDDGFSDVIVGAPSYDNGETDEGRAFVYLGSASGLASLAAWTAESDQASSIFSSSVATAGDVNGDGFHDVIIGAPRYTSLEIEDGRAFVYLGSATGLSTSFAWTAESGQTLASFAASVSTAGDVDNDGFSDVIVGAPTFDDGEIDEGSAFVYLGSASGPSATPDWTAEIDQAGANVGASVATAGDVSGDGFSDVIIGAPSYDGGETDEGEVLVYLGSRVGLLVTPIWTLESDQALARLGTSVALAGDVDGDGYGDVIAGASEFDDVEVDEGRAYVYFGSSRGLDELAEWTVESDQGGAFLGYAVANAGDVNGDGYTDVVVGAYQFTNGHNGEGRAFVYHGAPTGLSPAANWTAESNQPNAQFGSSVASAGDVNGDGYSDVVIGSVGYDNGQTNEGRVFLYLGSSTGLATSPAWTSESDQAFAQFGFSVGSAGDVNGDGLGDVIVGAYLYDDGESDEGRVFVYHGSATGLSSTPAWTAASDQVDAWFGYSVATAGDVNRDEYSDVILGSIAYDAGESNEGRVFVYLGSSSGLAATPAWTAESDQTNAQLGYSVAPAGDVNGDGYSDVIVGANQYDNGQNDEGRAFVFFGSAAGLSATPDWTAESDQASAQFGRSVRTAGDVDNDGYADVIVGSALYDAGETDEGRAFVYAGSASGLSATPSWTDESDLNEGFFGWSVSTAGDVNGDGFGDIVVGAWGWSFGQTKEGEARCYLGNDGSNGWTLAAQQRNAANTAPIDLLGGWSTKNQIRLQLRFPHTLAGFDWASGVAPTVRLQWEIELLRDPLDGDAILSGIAQPYTGSPLLLNDPVNLAPASESILPAPTFGIVHPLAAGAFHWRARARTNNPLLPVTPWVTLPWNNDTESKLRVGRQSDVLQAR